MGELGLFGLPFPEEYGGMGGDYFALCLAIEELARVDSSVAITLEAAVSLGAPQRPVAFTVPTGNFGDVLAGSVARAMGLPVARLVVATTCA